MTSLDKAIMLLREKMEKEYQAGESRLALETSIELDSLIAMRQREWFLREKGHRKSMKC